MSSFRRDLFVTSGSGITSEVYGTYDAQELTAEIDIDSATTVVIQGSNATGFRETIADDDWSTLTTMIGVSANEIVNIEPGFRWIRALRETASTASFARFTVAGYNVGRRRGAR